MISLSEVDNFHHLITLDQNEIAYPWNDKQWELIKNHPNYYCIFSNEGSGFALIHETDVYHLLKIVTPEKERRSGHAKKIIKALIDNAKRKNVYLEVATHNLAAIKLYESNGFLIVDRVSNYYSDNSDCLKMLYSAK